MISVSNEFKKAIKKTERQIKGYVEVLYDLPDISLIEEQTNTNITTNYTSLNQIFNGMRVENLYGSLDYLPLNGEYITMDDGINQNAGLISDELGDNLGGKYIAISFSQRVINGMTLYFRTNIPEEFRIELSDGSEIEIENNDKEMIQIIFDNPKTLRYANVVFLHMKYRDRKIYVNEIDLGITQVYKDQDLIEFTVDEEVNKLVEEVPTNETNITLNNMRDLFNPLNPQGIVPYLTEKTLIKPYIGVFTENSGIEYVKMGEFYFDSYTNNSDLTTTLVGKNIIKQVETEILKDDIEFDLFNSVMNKNNFKIYMLFNYDYKFDNLDFSTINSLNNINNKYLINLLKEISFFNTTLFYADRNNKLNLRNIDLDIKDNLTKTELIKDVEYKKIDKINTLMYLSPVQYSMNTTGSRLVYEREITLETSPQIVLCESNIPNMMDSITHVDGADSVSVISQGYYFTFIKITGTVGNTMTIRMASPYDMLETIGTKKRSNKGANEKEVVINFQSKIVKDINSINTLNYTPSYEMKFDYNGDPSLEAGDYINVQTPYGYKPLFIQKNRFKFDGGLGGSIEGVE